MNKIEDIEKDFTSFISQNFTQVMDDLFKSPTQPISKRELSNVNLTLPTSKIKPKATNYTYFTKWLVNSNKILFNDRWYNTLDNLPLLYLNIQIIINQIVIHIVDLINQSKKAKQFSFDTNSSPQYFTKFANQFNKKTIAFYYKTNAQEELILAFLFLLTHSYFPKRILSFISENDSKNTWNQNKTEIQKHMGNFYNLKESLNNFPSVKAVGTQLNIRNINFDTFSPRLHEVILTLFNQLFSQEKKEMYHIFLEKLRENFGYKPDLDKVLQGFIGFTLSTINYSIYSSALGLSFRSKPNIDQHIILDKNKCISFISQLK